VREAFPRDRFPEIRSPHEERERERERARSLILKCLARRLDIILIDTFSFSLESFPLPFCGRASARFFPLLEFARKLTVISQVAATTIEYQK